ncbi:MAG: helix-turn-helix domain-containing protein [Janthinobacterium lividum]
MADGAGVSQAGLTKGARITGDQRSSLATTFGERYAGGESIRSIAVDTGRSYGFVHGVLKESGASLRGRGGATRGPRRTPVDEVGGEDAAGAVGSSTASPATTKAKVKVEKAGRAKGAKDDKAKKKAEPKKGKKSKKG